MGEGISPGAVGERIAADYLALRGCRLLEKNFRSGHLEIDLIVGDGDCLAFVEVKTRRGDSYGEAIEAVRPKKIANIRKAARAFLSGVKGSLGFSEIRFDLVAIDLDLAQDVMVLRHLKGIVEK